MMDGETSDKSRPQVHAELTEIDEVASISHKNLANSVAKPSETSLSTLHHAGNAALWRPQNYHQNNLKHHSAI